MEALRQYWNKGKTLIYTYEERFDQWLLRGPLAMWRHLRFRLGQRSMYTQTGRRVSILGTQIFIGGYLLSNLGEIDLNQYSWSEPRRLMTEYQILSNIAEYDQLDIVGQDKHLKEMFNRGRQRGLSQVQLFQLSKYLQLNHTSKNVVYHAEYLRTLKS